MISKLSIWNQAVALIRAKAIQSENEDSLEARECRRHYPDIILSLLEGPHDWGFATRRFTLNALVNDREDEWLYAYGLPSDLASPVHVLPNFEGFGLGLPIPLPGNPYFEVWSTMQQGLSAPYIIENGTLYTNAEDAILVYVTTTGMESHFSAKLASAVAHELASFLAMSIKGNEALADKYANKAEMLRQRAIADDANRQPQSYPPYVSEAEIARQG
jgi:hypothetical protein